MAHDVIPQLRVRTEFSFRKTYAPVPRIAARIAELGAPAAGIVDPGTWGHVRWAKAAAKAGFRPLFGTELTVPQENGMKPTAWALAAEMKGFYTFSSAARQPAADVQELFARHAGSLVRFAGAALEDPALFDYVDINPDSAVLARHSLALAARTGKPLVLTSDNAYGSPADYNTFMAMCGDEAPTPQHLLTLDEMRAEFAFLDDAAFAAAVRNTHEAAERCASVLNKAPIISVPGDLRALTLAGKARRIARGHIECWDETYDKRLERELAVIAEKAFESYFIVVADLISWAKERMLVGPGRGSSAGSLVCYCLGITEVDPLPHQLLFERFIDVTRADLPDIDIDFSDRQRDKVFDYLAEKYGRECVARIGNVNTLKPKSALAEVCKRLGVPEAAKFEVFNVLIDYSSGDSRYGHALEDTLTQTEPGRRFAEKYPEAMVVRDVEGHASHTGIHAAGVIVCNVPVTEYCTVTAEGVAQIDKPDSEYLNLLKIDALGLRTLGVLEDSGVVTGEQLYALKLNDPEVFAVFNERRYAGVFQFEGQAQRRVSAQIRVTDFKQIDHITALARPGPLGGGAANTYILRAAGREAVTFRHPTMAEYLGPTMGVVLYQEQVMRIVREIGKFSWEATTTIRKAMSGRKGKEFFDQQGEMFFAGAAQDGIPREEAAAIWNEICSFGAWGMNKSVFAGQRVKLAHPNQFLGSDPTIEELYNYYKVNPSAWIRQQKSMPILLSLSKDGIAKPKEAVDLTYNGEKECVELEFEDGRKVSCSRDHKFIINGIWMRCGDAKVGDSFVDCARHHHIKNQSFQPGAGKGWRRGFSDRSINGRFTEERKFKLSRKGSPCEDCQKKEGRKEVHHNDLCHGKERPTDMAWLCSGCHKKRHMDAGDWLPPYARGWAKSDGATLKSVRSIGVQKTYDIHMPDPDHNYLLANGIVTHNSHTVSYGVISYWCAWMKRYHPLEYAAACLRSAKDDEQTMEILRDMATEGIAYTAFDIDASQSDWSVVNGRLLGGFQNLHGIGPSKAALAIEKRKAGKLVGAARDKILAAKVKFADLYPLRTLYGAIMEDPEAHGCQIGSVVSPLGSLPEQGGSVLCIVQVVRKELRDENETVRVARREGRRLSGPTIFLDIFVTDDSGVPCTLRIDRRQFANLRWARAAADNLSAGDHLMVRGKAIPNFNMIRVDRMKCLNRPEVLNG